MDSEARGEGGVKRQVPRFRNEMDSEPFTETESKVQQVLENSELRPGWLTEGAYETPRWSCPGNNATWV